MVSSNGKIFNIQRFSIEDGPGIRTTVFLKGCPLQCAWCSNPESQSPDQQVANRESLCIKCGCCIVACQAKALGLSQNSGTRKITINREKCDNCGKCINVCPTGAMKFFGRTMTADDVFSEVKKDTAYYSRSQGGVTVSGGEPLLQADFVAELFRRCQAAGIHTTLDTCGYFEPSMFDKVSDLVNLVLFDIKLMDRAQHKQYTGVYNDVILQNARMIAHRGIQMIIRIPVIPDINDTEDNFNETARFISAVDDKLSVNLLPYHNYGQKKYEMLGMDYSLSNTKPPDSGQMFKHQAIFKRYGLDCTIQ